MCRAACKTCSGASRVTCAQRTARSARRSPRPGVRFFSERLVAQGRDPVLEELTRPAIRRWLAQLNDTKESSTVRTRYRGLFRFCGWLVDEGELAEHPMTKLSPPEPRSKPVPVLSDAELTALLKACNDKDFRDRRDEAMIRLLLDCGLRVSELCGLTVDGVDLDGGMALVTGKGSKVRPVYFGARTTRALDRYLRMRGAHRWRHLSALFLTQRGAMAPDGVRERMKVRGAAAGIEDLHPHRPSVLPNEDGPVGLSAGPRPTPWARTEWVGSRR